MKKDDARRIRLETGYNQEEFARLIGVGRNWVNRYESGKVPINAALAGRIERVRADGIKRPDNSIDLMRRGIYIFLDKQAAIHDIDSVIRALHDYIDARMDGPAV